MLMARQDLRGRHNVLDPMELPCTVAHAETDARKSYSAPWHALRKPLRNESAACSPITPSE